MTSQSTLTHRAIPIPLSYISHCVVHSHAKCGGPLLNMNPLEEAAFETSMYNYFLYKANETAAAAAAQRNETTASFNRQPMTRMARTKTFSSNQMPTKILPSLLEKLLFHPVSSQSQKAWHTYSRPDIRLLPLPSCTRNTTRCWK